jgi:cytochrome c biogenesis protein CcmG/thiol:disulfide interchange protein DsbE
LQVLIVAASLAATACSRPGPVRASLKRDSERKTAPNFSLKDADGRTVQLSDYRGKVVLLNFWATWCGPCKLEIPWFMEFERKYKEQGFAVVGVAMDDDGWNAVKPFAREEGMNYRILMGDDTTAQLYGGVDSLPTTFLIDRAGKIAAVHVGLVGKSSYENDLKELFDSSRTVRNGGFAGGAAVLVGAR